MIRIAIKAVKPVPPNSKLDHLQADHADEVKAANTYGQRQSQHPALAPMFKEIQGDEQNHQAKLEKAMDSGEDNQSQTPDDYKTPQHVSGYMGPEFGPFECQHCVHWEEPNACNIVSGKLDPHGCCNLFEQFGHEATSKDLDKDQALESPEEDIKEGGEPKS